MGSNWKYLLDAVLVMLIIVLIWSALRSRVNNRNDDRS
jgi:hypothetical protein